MIGVRRATIRSNVNSEKRVAVCKAVKNMKLESRKPLSMTVKGSTNRLQLQNLSIQIVSCGSLIEATLEMVWFNPFDEVVEGELQLPLEEGAAVCGYAVDIDERMVPGVIVEKEKARAVFEQEVREHKSAPAIAEQVAGNLFKTRIHPFKPKVKKKNKN